VRAFGCVGELGLGVDVEVIGRLLEGKLGFFGVVDMSIS